MMKFDQLAVIATTEEEQKRAMSIAPFPVRDVVTAVGFNSDGKPIRNVAELAFDYNLWPGGLEYEVLRYVEGWNWHRNVAQMKTSHFGIHVQSIEELVLLREGKRTLQEVVTVAHENPACADRRYHYVILDAFSTLGTTLKLIRRLTVAEGVAMHHHFLAGAR